MVDAAETVIVPPDSPQKRRLVNCARSAFRQAMKAARAGNRVYDIGRQIEEEVSSRGFSVMRELTGHGVGRTIHEEPSVPNYYDPRFSQELTSGLVVAIEPIIASGGGESLLCSDGWTVKTADGSLSAHHEHTVVITQSQPLILTAA